MTASLPTAPTLLLFARFPREGQVKTRLAAGLGTALALRIYRAMLLDSIDRFCAVPAARRRLFLSGCSLQEGQELLAESGRSREFTVALQEGPDLGSRLVNGLAECGRCEGGFLVLGADSPTVPLAYVRRAVRALARVPVILGPAVDGGYYLLAMRGPRRELFEGIDWGSSRVLEQTLSRLRPDEYLLLPRWTDLDTAGDVKTARAALLASPCRTSSRLRGVLVGGVETRAAPEASNRERTGS